MAIAMTPVGTAFNPIYDTTQGTMLLRGTLVFSGSYTTGGDTINFSTHAVGVASPIASNRRPIGMQFWEEPTLSTTPVTGVAALLYYRNTSAKPNSTNGVIQISTAA